MGITAFRARRAGMLPALWRALWAGTAVVGLALLCRAAAAQDEMLLCDFEDESALKAWEVTAGTPALVAEGATHGAHALQITFDPHAQYHGAYLLWRQAPRDWSHYDALVLDVFNPTSAPVTGYVLIADAAWAQQGRSYWNRHNGLTTFAPGRSKWLIPVRGLYRGEAGSRNNDIRRNIDPDSIVRVDFGFGDRGTTGRIVIDNLMLVKATRPAGVWAFDFGPPSQAVMPGWTPVSHETTYAPERGYGWGPGGHPWDGAARDTTFGPMLLRDFCEAGGYNFHVAVPEGRYHTVVFYENSGYWSEEQAMQKERRILANGRLAWHQTRPDGPAHALYRFEDVEPVGVDVWDTYMKAELARPAEFEADADQNGITLRFEADRVWGSKVAGLALYRADDEPAAAWYQTQLDALAKEFRSAAVCLDPPAAPFDVPAEWQKAGLVAWPVRIEEAVTPNSVPLGRIASPADLAISRLAVRDEYEPFCLALRPIRDLGKCSIELEPLSGPGKLESAVSVVHYNTSRLFNSLAYHIAPHTLRLQRELQLPKDLTREIVVTVHVPAEASPGEYVGALAIAGADGKALLRAPLRLPVRPVTLDQGTNFEMGFFGLMPPGMLPKERRQEALEQTLAMLREHGMNGVCGGPSWRLKGWQDGEPLIDFDGMDDFFSLLRKRGFDMPLNGYGGARFEGLHDGYQKGERGAAAERESGLPYEEALMRAWRAVDAHARQAGWPTILYAMCDETRVRETAERELQFMQMMKKVSAAFPKTVRTSGSYSVSFAARPADLQDLLYWHQRFFDALDVSSLNGHDELVMEEARKLGKEIQIYNQGRSRYSFGLYQWREYRKGVRARWEWHLNILHGYQFFDLDGREPDIAMICYGRNALYPTIQFERCRQGAQDFYLYNILWRLVEARRAQGGKAADLDAAAALLDDASSKARVGDRREPEGFDADALKAQVVAAIEKLQ